MENEHERPKSKWRTMITKEKIRGWLKDLGKYLLNLIKPLWIDRTGFILATSVLLLTFWGPVGKFELLFPLDLRDRWLGTSFAWRDQLVTFVSGFILLVIIPCVIIKTTKRFKGEKLGAFGLGWPKDKQTRKEALFAFVCFLVIATASCVFGGLQYKSMQCEYPLFPNGAITTWPAFIVYELVYLIFFITIEFIFRGYLLFGLHSAKDVKRVDGANSALLFGPYAILISMLSYNMWHIFKPVPEYIGALFWGVLAGAIALRIRTIWPIIIAHWLGNVALDTVLWIKFP